MKSHLIIILFIGYVGCEKVAEANKALGPDGIETIISRFESELRTDLSKDGIDIARRTVAKYREALRIPSSVERRRLRQLESAASGR